MQGDKKTFKQRLNSAWCFVKKIAARVWSYLKVAKMEYIVMISLFALDLITKAVVNACVDYGDTVVLIPKFLNIHNYHNYDAAFGSEVISNALGAVGSRILFSVFAVAASVVFIILLIRNKGGHKLFRIALAMLTAGAMGNCIDRWALGYVRDFIEFVYFGLTINGHTSFYIFNFADAELVIAVVLVVIYFIFIYRDKSDEAKEAKSNKTESTGESAAVSEENKPEPDAENAQADLAVQDADVGAEALDVSVRAGGETPDGAENAENDKSEIDAAAENGTAETETDNDGDGGAN